MANAKILEQKSLVVDEIKGKFENAKSVVVFDPRGLNVAEVTELRRALRESGSDYKVYKNTLVKRAVNSLDIKLDELKKFSKMGILTQISCSSIVNRATRKKSLQLIDNDIVQIIGSNNNECIKSSRNIGDIAIDILNKDITTNIQDIVKPSPQYADAVRIMRYNLAFGKYKHIKNNAGMIISNASLNDVLANI